MSGIFDFLGSVIKPITDMVDGLHTSAEEKQQLKLGMMKVHNEYSVKVLEYETRLMESQASIIKAETSGASWMQRNWRPITMLTFLVLVVCDSFGILAFRLAGEAWTLLQIGLGGYVVGRTAEKITPTITEALGKKK